MNNGPPIAAKVCMDWRSIMPSFITASELFILLSSGLRNCSSSGEAEDAARGPVYT